jgi:hypothetical protein
MVPTQRVKVQEFSLDTVNESERFVAMMDDPIGIERFILQIKDPRMVEILTLRALGLKYHEIVPIVQISINQYYILLRKLKKDIDIWN